MLHFCHETYTYIIYFVCERKIDFNASCLYKCIVAYFIITSKKRLLSLMFTLLRCKKWDVFKYYSSNLWCLDYKVNFSCIWFRIIFGEILQQIKRHILQEKLKYITEKRSGRKYVYIYIYIVPEWFMNSQIASTQCALNFLWSELRLHSLCIFKRSNVSQNCIAILCNPK